MGNIVYCVSGVFQILVFLITCYYLVLGIFGIYKKKETKNYTPKNSFAMIVAAHDEEVVIAKLIESMQKQNYPKELYDIFVIADNCTDKTAEIARSYGVTVCERVNAEKRGKGYALEWMFEKLFNMEKQYDAVTIFDADNIVHKDFLKEMNSKLQEGYKVVQGYIDSKNPDDSWIAASYSIAFWSQNRLFQLSRNNIGLSNQIGGTGFAISTDTLKEYGWGAACLTEDLEFTCKMIMNNQKVGWAHDAKIYDEKPLKLKQSWVQRRRWMQGFADVASRYAGKLIKKAFKEKSWYIFDAAIYVFQPFVTLLLGVSTILGVIQSKIPHSNIFVVSDMVGNVGFKVFVLIQFILTPLVLMLDKKASVGFFVICVLFSSNIFLTPVIMNWIDNWNYGILVNLGYYTIFILASRLALGKGSMLFFIRFLLYSVYTVTWIPITLQGIIRKNNKEWNHTKHVRNVEISEND
ncbi:MAG: glycosyltransferase family 2 protein [Clostridium sp.]|nr:glycosyltransferase family 2 protein [Clostridium sp.]